MDANISNKIKLFWIEYLYFVIIYFMSDSWEPHTKLEELWLRWETRHRQNRVLSLMNN